MAGVQTVVKVTPLKTGDSVSSGVLALENTTDVEYLIRATQTGLSGHLPSTVYIVVEDLESSPRRTFTAFSTFTQGRKNLDEIIGALTLAPSRIRIRAECIEGSAKIQICVIERPLPLRPPNISLAPPAALVVLGNDETDSQIQALQPTAPLQYLGTDVAGDFGFFTLSGAVGDHSHIDAETPLGVIDGVNDTFTLAMSPDPTTSLMLFKNGVLLRQGGGEDYTLSGATITYEADQIPQVGQSHIAFYRIP